MQLDPDRDIVLERELNAPRQAIWTCWTTPEHLVHWFVPKPHRVTACTIDLRVGGAFNTTFDVDGRTVENPGVFLEVIPAEKLVFTDGYAENWRPTPDPFMTAILTLGDLGPDRTRYRIVMRHRTKEIAQQHLDHGFYTGWGVMADQLETYARGLK